MALHLATQASSNILEEERVNKRRQVHLFISMRMRITEGHRKSGTSVEARRVLGQATWTYKNGDGAGGVLLREPWRDLCPVSLRAAGTAKTADASPNSASAWIALLILAFGKNEKPNGSCQRN